jgi:hypothetical protein
MFAGSRKDFGYMFAANLVSVVIADNLCRAVMLSMQADNNFHHQYSARALVYIDTTTKSAFARLHNFDAWVIAEQDAFVIANHLRVSLE